MTLSLDMAIAFPNALSLLQDLWPAVAVIIGFGLAFALLAYIAASFSMANN